MSTFRKFIISDVKQGTRAGLQHTKIITEKDRKCIVRVLEARPSQPLKTPEVSFLIRMEGPTGVKLKKARIIVPLMEGPTGVEQRELGIITPLMEGPTGLPVCKKNKIHTHIINRNYGKRGIKNAKSGKIY